MLNSSLEDRFLEDSKEEAAFEKYSNGFMHVQLLRSGACIPTVSHPDKDLGYDLYCAVGAFLRPGIPTKVYTGVAVDLPGFGFIAKDRSSLAARGISISAGVIDEGYTGEIVLIMTLAAGLQSQEYLHVGDKIAQIVPVRPLTVFPIKLVDGLRASTRGSGGFGSTGK